MSRVVLKKALDPACAPAASQKRPRARGHESRGLQLWVSTISNAGNRPAFMACINLQATTLSPLDLCVCNLSCILPSCCGCQKGIYLCAPGGGGGSLAAAQLHGQIPCSAIGGFLHAVWSWRKYQSHTGCVRAGRYWGFKIERAF